MSDAKFIKTVLILCFASCVAPLATDMYLPSLTTIAGVMNSSINDMQLTVSVFFGGFAVGQLFYGPVSDALGRRKIILAGTLLFTLASLGAVLTTDFRVFFCMRLLQALGGAAGAVIANAVMKDIFRGTQFNRAINLSMIAMSLAPLVAPTLGGFLAGFGWKYCFYLLTFIGVMILIFIGFGIKESLPVENRQPLNFRAVAGNYRRILGHRGVCSSVLAQAMNCAAMFAFISGASSVYMGIYGLDSMTFGIVFAMNVVTIMAVVSFTGFFVKRFGFMPTFLSALCLSAAGGTLLLAGALVEVESIVLVIIPVVMTVCTVGLVGALSTTYTLGKFPEMTGTASSVMGFMRFGLGSIAGLVFNCIPGKSAVPMAGTMFVLSVGALLVFLLSRRYRRDDPAIPGAVKEKVTDAEK
jgi:DHA1 family bicyclomycin/chloramphenicol resistance-like MFS transporter